MKVKEITLTTAPTIRIRGDYIKAGATITVTVGETENHKIVTKQALKILKDIYEQTLLQELDFIEDVISGTRDDREAIIGQIRKMRKRRITRKKKSRPNSK